MLRIAALNALHFLKEITFSPVQPFHSIVGNTRLYKASINHFHFIGDYDFERLKPISKQAKIPSCQRRPRLHICDLKRTKGFHS